MDCLENGDMIRTPNMLFLYFSVSARKTNGVNSNLLGIYMKKTVFAYVFTVS